MGKIFPLSQNPSRLNEVIKLVEECFDYQVPNSFLVDFAPLMAQENLHNCYVYEDENKKIIAHIGVKEKFIQLNEYKFSITLLGGIAVDSAYRGKGLFKELMTHVLSEKKSDTTFFLLWSDQSKLYEKFGFHLCGTQFEYSEKNLTSPYIETTYSHLTDVQKKQIQDLYQNSFQKNYLTFERTLNDWETISKITSAKIFIEIKKEEIMSYYFKGKGQDLNEIIYEYGSQSDFKSYISQLMNWGKVWSSMDIGIEGQMQYQFLISPGDQKLFSNFVYELTQEKIKIEHINLIKKEVFFKYNDELLVLGIQDFLQGIWGPGKFEEIDSTTFFVSGIDSI